MRLSELDALIDWDAAMAAPRYAGGHNEVMSALFKPPTRVIAWWTEDDYQGTIAYAYQFTDGTVALMVDYFGSCSGCDSWEDATDDDARAMISAIVHSARIKPSIDAALVYCNEEVIADASEYPMYACKNLVNQLRALLAPAPPPAWRGTGAGRAPRNRRDRRRHHRAAGLRDRRRAPRRA